MASLIHVDGYDQTPLNDGSSYVGRHFVKERKYLACPCFYSHEVERLPVDPAISVRFLAGTGKIFSLYNNIDGSPI